MPTNHDETLHERYAREHQAELARFARMTPEQISELVTDLHNALAERDAALAELAALKCGREVACYQFQTREGTWRQFDNERHYQDTLKAGGWPIRALYTAPPAQASAWVPEGWKLVPVEPTGAMMLNESGCQHHAWDDNGCAARRVRFGVWAKMLAAAPTPGVSDGNQANA